MERKEVAAKVAEIISDILDVEIEDVEKVRRDEIEQWDSLEHINIIMEVETTFKIKFQLNELNMISEASIIIDKVMEKI